MLLRTPNPETSLNLSPPWELLFNDGTLKSPTPTSAAGGRVGAGLRKAGEAGAARLRRSFL